jgi:hypothetical protein
MQKYQDQGDPEKDRAMHKTFYPCLKIHDCDHAIGGGPCVLTASYFALDNRARLGHLCRQCWKSLPTAERDLYVEIGATH